MITKAQNLFNANFSQVKGKVVLWDMELNVIYTKAVDHKGHGYKYGALMMG